MSFVSVLRQNRECLSDQIIYFYNSWNCQMAKHLACWNISGSSVLPSPPFNPRSIRAHFHIDLYLRGWVGPCGLDSGSAVWVLAIDDHQVHLGERCVGRLGGVLGRLGRVLQASWAVSGASWSVLGASWGPLGASCAHVRFLIEFRSIFGFNFDPWNPQNYCFSIGKTRFFQKIAFRS